MKKITLGLLLAASAGLAKAQCNLVTNGNFTAGGSGFTSNYLERCESAISLYPEGTYCVSGQANDHHNGFAACNNGGNIMVVNGAVSQLSPGVYKSVWSQTIAVKPNRNYTFSVDAATVVNLSAAVLRLSVNGSSAGTSTLSLTNCSWQTLTYVWYSGSATTAVLNITDENTAPSGNDFALDNISFHTASVLTVLDVEDADCGSTTGSIKVKASIGDGPYSFTITSASSSVTYNASSGIVLDSVFTFLSLPSNTSYNISVTNGCGDVTTTSAIVRVGQKVAIAHRTGSAKNPCRNICVAAAAVPAHLGHGDQLGMCGPARMISANRPDDIQVVPNPNAGVFMLNLPFLETNASMQITDVQGRIIQKSEVAEDASSVDINISHLGRGVYFISVFDGDHSYRAKFVVE